MHQFTGEEFEEEVRKIARNLFSNSIGQGAENVDGRERDGIFWNGDFYTVVEATTDRKQAKAEYDAKKTHDLVTKKRSEGNMARGYVVTLHEPTADQRAAVKKFERTTKIISFDELRSLLFDAPSYLRTRSEKAFGSVYDHAAHTFNVPREEFVEPTTISFNKSNNYSINDVERDIIEGKRLIITAEYGIGKSMFLREIFFRLIDKYHKKSTLRIPLAINLREHMGQEDPVELLERHARNNAADPRKLVAAWSAGYLDLIIDGFDELSTRGWTGDHRKLREFRRSTHKVLKNLIRHTPVKASVIISGREAYFDSEKEMREALGASTDNFSHYVIQPFDLDQATNFLNKKGISQRIPSWMPTRPLFLNYLVGKDLLQEAISVKPSGSFPEGSAWKTLLSMIAERESDQSEGVDKEAIFDFWGYMATRARQSPSMQKSFSPSEMDEIFHAATGNTVSEDERRLLLRLPGLGVAPDNQANRIFIDNDFLNASSGRLIFRHLQNPYGDENYKKELRAVTQPISNIGSQVVCSYTEEHSIPFGLIDACLKNEIINGHTELAYDIFSSTILIGKTKEALQFDGLDITELDLCNEYYDGLSIKFIHCLIENLILPQNGDLNRKIIFSDCLIGNIDGRVSEKDIPREQFINCDLGHFKYSYSVNSEVLDTSLPLGVKVLIVTLRKVYTQGGTSRLESALLRGLDHRARMIASDVISSMIRNNFLTVGGRQGKTIYAGVREMRKVALEIIQSPSTSQHPIIEDCKRLA